MGQDVHQIEAQNKGMQVTRNNQHALHNEIETLMKSLRVPAYVIEVLKNEPLDQLEGVKECENAINKIMGIIKFKFDGQSQLLAVKERVNLYQTHANDFAGRLFDYLEAFFSSQATAYLNDKNRASQRNALKLYAHELLEQKLFKFKKLVGWLKETDARKHYDLQIGYVAELGRAYNREIQDFLEQLKQHISRKGAAEDHDFCTSY
jgi:exocyst complex component 1